MPDTKPFKPKAPPNVLIREGSTYEFPKPEEAPLGTRTLVINLPLGMHQTNLVFLRRAIHKLVEMFVYAEQARADGGIEVGIKMVAGICQGKLRKNCELTEDLK